MVVKVKAFGGGSNGRLCLWRERWWRRWGFWEIMSEEWMKLDFWKVLSGCNESLLGFNEGWGPHNDPKKFHNFKSVGLTWAVSGCWNSKSLEHGLQLSWYRPCQISAQMNFFFSDPDMGRVRLHRCCVKLPFLPFSCLWLGFKKISSLFHSDLVLLSRCNFRINVSASSLLCKALCILEQLKTPHNDNN